MKKAAMFGLDARIALAIFGALSVISGAALYSAIQDSKVTSLITELSEIGKAIESYMLDTGEDVPIAVSTNVDLEKLLSSTVANWNGPYISVSDDTSGDENLPHSLYTAVKSRVWGFYGRHDSLGNPAGQHCNSANAPCYYFIEVEGVPLDIAKSIDLRIDGSNDFTSGRIQAIASGSNAYIYYRSHLSFKQK